MARRKCNADDRVKFCPKCKTEKAISEFGSAPATKDGRRGHCKLCHNAANAAWRARNPETQRQAVIAWNARNPERRKEIQRRANRKRYSDPCVKLHCRMLWRIRNSLAGKYQSTFDFGFTMEELRAHMERQFSRGMSWAAFDRGEIHIDHIRPLSEFTYSSTDDQQFKQAWSLWNLRPLWATENKRKKNKRLFLI